MKLIFEEISHKSYDMKPQKFEVKYFIDEESGSAKIGGYLRFPTNVQCEIQASFVQGSQKVPLIFDATGSETISPSGYNRFHVPVDAITQKMFEQPVEIFVTFEGKEQRILIGFDVERSQKLTVIAELHEKVMGLRIGNEEHAKMLPGLQKQTRRLDKKLQAHPYFKEIMIVLSVHTQDRLDRAIRMFNRVHKIYRRAGADEIRAEFVERITTAIYPYTNSRHGFTIPFANRSNHDVIWKELDNRCAKIEEMGYSIFANSGTLLGIVRENGFLLHDDDVDMGVLLSATNIKDAAREWLAFREKMQKSGLLNEHLTLDQTLAFPHIKTNSIDGVEIDIFPAWVDEDSKLYIWPHSFGQNHIDDFLPLVATKFHNLKMPKNAASILVNNYGPTWDQKGDGWGFDWKEARIKFASFEQEVIKLAKKIEE